MADEIEDEQKRAGAPGSPEAEAPDERRESAEAKPKPKPKRAPRARKAPAAAAKSAAAESESKGPRRKAAKKAVEPTEPTPAAPDRRRGAASTQPPLVRAHAKYVRTSARKARLVCDHIRGKPVDEARTILAFAPRAVARDWAKLLDSAVANAEHNHELVGEDLRVKEAFADEGPTIKRFRPRAMGRATPIRKRTAHLTITLTPKDGD